LTCEFFGVTRDEMKGRRWQMLMHPDEADAYTNEFLSCVRAWRPFHAEVAPRLDSVCCLGRRPDFFICDPPADL